ncbi:hypothetical protein TWF694_011030 [Orbilia ellipsospora]|uniref:Zinc finger C2H2 LYAR-type domain-containing protein n=1 Tax=Orbilia ellipsospora TaxID=2528407 RepID=A0AAV9X7T8_9PEZI
MVSFSCEACNETLAKKKLDQHRGRCRQAAFTCLDCNNTFYGTSYREHTSCISEAQKYERTVYRGEKKKGKGGKGGQQNGVNGVHQSEEAVVEAVPAVVEDVAAAPEETVEEEVTEDVKEEKKSKKDKKDKKDKKEKKEKKDKKAKEEEVPVEDVVMDDAPEVTEEPHTEKKEKKEKKDKKDKKDKKEKKSKTKKEEDEEPATEDAPEEVKEDEKPQADTEESKSEKKKSKKEKKDKKNKKAKKELEESEESKEESTEEPPLSLDDIIMEDTTPTTNGTSKVSKKRKRIEEIIVEGAPAQEPNPTSNDLEAQADFISFGDSDEDKKKTQERKKPKTEKEILRDERRTAAKLNYDQTYKKLKTELEAKYNDTQTLEPRKASFKNGTTKGPALIGVKCMVREIMKDPLVQSLTPKEAKHIKNRLRKDERKKRLLAANKKGRDTGKEMKKSPKILKDKLEKLEAKIEKDRRKQEKLARQIAEAKKPASATSA